MLSTEAIANLRVNILETHNYMQVDEINLRPLNPRPEDT